MTWNAPDVDLVAGLERDQRVVVELVLLDLVAEQAAGERRGVDRHARELGQDVRQGADVVLVGMGDQERLDVGAALLEVGDVGDDEVDPEHLLVGEHEAAVDDDDLVAVLEDVHVLADLPHPAERDDAERLVDWSDRACMGSVWAQKSVSWSASGALGRGRGHGGRPASAAAAAPSAATGAAALGRRRARAAAARPLGSPPRRARATRAAPPGQPAMSA